MNKKYIKRQLTLMVLDIDVNQDIKEMYSYFCKLIDLDSLELIYLQDIRRGVNNPIMFYKNKSRVIIDYNYKDNTLYFDEDIYYSFIDKIDDRYFYVVEEILESMLEYSLKIEIYRFEVPVTSPQTIFGNLTKE